MGLHVRHIRCFAAEDTRAVDMARGAASATAGLHPHRYGAGWIAEPRCWECPDQGIKPDIASCSGSSGDCDSDDSCYGECHAWMDVRIPLHPAVASDGRSVSGFTGSSVRAVQPVRPLVQPESLRRAAWRAKSTLTDAALTFSPTMGKIDREFLRRENHDE